MVLFIHIWVKIGVCGSFEKKARDSKKETLDSKQSSRWWFSLFESCDIHSCFSLSDMAFLIFSYSFQSRVVHVTLTKIQFDWGHFNFLSFKNDNLPAFLYFSFCYVTRSRRLSFKPGSHLCDKHNASEKNISIYNHRRPRRCLWFTYVTVLRYVWTI